LNKIALTAHIEEELWFMWASLVYVGQSPETRWNKSWTKGMSPKFQDQAMAIVEVGVAIDGMILSKPGLE
jgi:hypothetical protein